MVRAVVIPADQDVPLEVREIDGLDDLQRAVDGLVEAIDIVALGATIFVNEEGLIRRLPFNARASFLWWYHSSSQAMLVGDAVLVGLPDEHGDLSDVPAHLQELLMADGPFVLFLKLGNSAQFDIRSSVVMPLVAGRPHWLVTTARFQDYFSAAAWARVLSERLTGLDDVVVAPGDKASDILDGV